MMMEVARTSDQNLRSQIPEEETGVRSLEFQQTEHEADHSPPSNALRIRETVLPKSHTSPFKDLKFQMSFLSWLFNDAVLVNTIQRRSRVLLKETGPSVILVKVLFVRGLSSAV
jgi:hypothetical protein